MHSNHTQKWFLNIPKEARFPRSYFLRGTNHARGKAETKKKLKCTSTTTGYTATSQRTATH